MDGWGDAPSEAESRTWLAMDLLAPVHDLWALEVVSGSGGEAPAAVQALTEGLLGEHRPELTEAALAGLVDLERALVVGAALEVARGLVESGVLVAVECALVDEACRLSLLPLVNAAADLLLELERDAVQDEVAQDEAAQDEVAQDEVAQDEVAQDEVAQDETGKQEAAEDEVAQDETGKQEAAEDEVAQCDPVGSAGSADPADVSAPLPAEAAAGARCEEHVGWRAGARFVRWRGSRRPDRGRGSARRPVVVAGGARTRGPPRVGAVRDGGCRAHADHPGAWGQGPRSQSSR